MNVFMILIGLLLPKVYSLNSDKVPVRINNKYSSKLITAGVLGAGLIGGKYIYDGPKFDEIVDMKGKNVVITGNFEYIDIIHIYFNC